jgi:hypothetical protein
MVLVRAARGRGGNLGFVVYENTGLFEDHWNITKEVEWGINKSQRFSDH